MSKNQQQAISQRYQQQVSMRAPEQFDFTKPETWLTWEKRFLRFISVANLSLQTSQEKIDWLCYSMGQQAEEILLTILPNAEAKSFDEVLKAFRNYFIPENNVILERFKFNTRVQSPGESIDAFISALYSLAEKCDYSTVMEDMIRDRIVAGIRDSKISERLKSKSDLTLTTAIKEVKEAEAQGQQAGQLSSLSTSDNVYECSLTSNVQGELRPASNPLYRKRRQHEDGNEALGGKKVHHVPHKDRAAKDNDVILCSAPNSHSSGPLSSVATSASPPKISSNDKSGLLDSEGFVNRFFKVLAKSNPGNLVVSPLSAEIMLAMAAYGAGGDTATQMRTSLQLPEDDDIGQSRYHLLLRKMNSEEEVELHIANKIFIASHLDVNPAYKKLTTKKFLSSPQHVDFENPRAAANAINTWCENQTEKRIKNIFEPESFAPDTLFVLVNAVYFKGQWYSPFTRAEFETQDRPFHIDEKTTKLLPTMRNMDMFRFGDIPKLDARFIDMPYKGENLSMIIILPNRIGGLKKVQDNLHQVNLEQSLQGGERRNVRLFVPKFKIESTFDLHPTLAKLGMTALFKGGANFSGITDVPLNNIEVVQTAFIEVNETGTEAAARTVLKGGGDPLQNPEFKVDRPFYFAIYHHQTRASIFTGIVKEPSYT